MIMDLNDHRSSSAYLSWVVISVMGRHFRHGSLPFLINPIPIEVMMMMMKFPPVAGGWRFGDQRVGRGHHRDLHRWRKENHHSQGVRLRNHGLLRRHHSTQLHGHLRRPGRTRTTARITATTTTATHDDKKQTITSNRTSRQNNNNNDNDTN